MLKRPLTLALSLAALLTLTSCAAGDEVGGAGKLDCPCASAESDGFEALKAKVESSDFPDLYGLDGCRPYDEDNILTGCAGDDKPGYCGAQWCYVDTARCRVDRAKCQAQNKQVGQKTHESCRSRPMLESALIPGGFYSYETCGYLNSYSVDRASEVIGVRTLIAAATHDVPYVSVVERPGPGPNDPPVVEYSGVEYVFLQKSLESFVEPVVLQMEDGWATAESRAKFSSSYTACVHDVAVGNFDICIGDFWVTSERMLMTMFLPAFRTDTFYLIVFDDATVWTFDELLRNPFQPFSDEAWALIAGVVASKALVEAVLDFAEEEEDGATRSSFLSRAFRSLYMAWISVFSGNSRFKGNSVPAQISNMGWQMFLLIVVASYKAQLAKMLILRSNGPTIASIDEAIEHRLKICIPEAIETTIRLNYPTGDYYVFGGSTADFARLMHADKCDTAVIHTKRLEQLHGGWIHKADCDQVRDGTLSEEEGRCERGHAGTERDDCDIMRVGDVLLSIPIAFPVSSNPEIVSPMSWAITQAQNSGEWEAAVISGSHLFPESYCDADFRKAQRLKKENFAGGAFFVALAILVGIGARTWQKRLGSPSKEKGSSTTTASVSEPTSDASGPVSPRSKAILAKLNEVSEMVRAHQSSSAKGVPDFDDKGVADSGFSLQSETGAVRTTSLGYEMSPATSYMDMRPVQWDMGAGPLVYSGGWAPAPAQTQSRGGMPAGR